MATKQTPAAKPNPASAKETPVTRSFLRDDFPYIRKASIAFGVSLALSATLVGGSGFLLSRQKAQKNLTQQQNIQALGKYTEAEIERREIREFQPKYLQLIVRGFVGEEKRLDWIEQIRDIQANRKLPPINYQISPQQPVQLDASIQTGEMELRSSKMLVRLDLLHELDLLNFLNDLKAKGYFTSQACAIRPADSIGDTPLSPKLSGECSLYWITLGPRAPADGTPPKAQ